MVGYKKVPVIVGFLIGLLWIFFDSVMDSGAYRHIKSETNQRDSRKLIGNVYSGISRRNIIKLDNGSDCKVFTKRGGDRRFKCGVEVSGSNFPLIPKLKKGNLNLAAAMYASTLTMCLAFVGDDGTTTFEMAQLQKDCRFHKPSVCHAVNIFSEHLNEKHVDFSSKLELFRVMKTREFAESPRPDSCDGCFEFTFNTLTEPSHICEGGEILLFMLIFTVPDESDKRDTIRNTWLSTFKNNTGKIRYVFYFGSGWSPSQQDLINCESQKHGDILQMDFKDSYYNLSYKMASGFKWAVDHCPRSKFIVRSAVDMYVNVPRMLLFARDQRRKGIFGNCLMGGVPYRPMFHKHSQTHNDYPHDAYGPFCSGTTFLISLESAKRFLRNAPNVPWFNLEDIWVGMVARKAEIHLKNVEGFNTKLSKKGDTCKLRQNWITIHEVDVPSMQYLFKMCLKRKPRTHGRDVLSYAKANRKIKIKVYRRQKVSRHGIRYT